MLENLPLYQRVYTKEQSVPFTYGAPFVLPLYYETSDGDTNLSGLTLNIHYNSAYLRPETVKDLLKSDLTNTAYLKDTNNLDEDLNTDSILQFIWMSFGTSFPGVSLPALVANISWIPAPPPGANGLPTQATGQLPQSTVIRYTASEGADSYAFAQDYTVIDFTPVLPPAPTYSLSADKTTYNEGDTVKVTVQTSDGAVKYLYYTCGGTNITSGDFTYDGNLYGSVVAAPLFPRFGSIQLAAGEGTFEQTLLKDALTEGVETLEIQLYKDYERTVPVGNSVNIRVEDSSRFAVLGRSLYTIVSGPSWIQAEANAEKLGGHLVTIEDQIENNFLKTFIPDDSRVDYGGAWIGITDQTQEGKWIWSSGILSVYKNFPNGQPDDAYGGQDFGIIFKDGLWNDANPQPGYKTQHQANGIAEIPFIRRGDSAYVIVQGPSWEEAEANAIKLGGHLVTIDSFEENQWLRKVFRNQHQWTGGTVSEQGISWIDGSTSNYQRWFDGLPTSDHIGLNIVLGNATYWYPNRGWDFTGIAEIKLNLRQNSPATGEINLTVESGYAIIKVARLDDADNTNGFTPEITFTIQVRTGEEEEWSDAGTGILENRSGNFKLIGNEIGRLMRVKISYIDQSGTLEEIYSDEVDRGLQSLDSLPFKRLNDSIYFEVKARDWATAESMARSYGGHLVTISSALENTWLCENFRDYYWTGLHYLNDQWTWSSGEKTNYANWYVGEPGQPKNGNAVVKSIDGMWYDIPMDLTVDYLSEQKGIIELNKPNNKPTATVRLVGEIKSGSNLTITFDTISDPDNINNYQPSYKYTWEVSRDEALWTQLASDDASDSNNTYSITTADVGKKIRGVVSYLDGLGTLEYIYSATRLIPDTVAPEIKGAELKYDTASHSLKLQSSISDTGSGVGEVRARITSVQSPSNCYDIALSIGNDGLYHGAIKLTATSPSGQWVVNRLVAFDGDRNLANLGSNWSTQPVSVITGGDVIVPRLETTDETQPYLKSVTTEINLPTSTYNIRANIVEAGSGVVFAQAWIRSRGTEDRQVIDLKYNSINHLWSGYFNLLDSGLSNTWELERFMICDAANNFKDYPKSEIPGSENFNQTQGHLEKSTRHLIPA